jgi:replicative DNA helicase
MSKKNKNTLGYLGQPFQLKFIGQILSDSKYANTIIDLVKPEYFEDEKLRLIVMLIIDNHEQFDAIPNFDDIDGILRKNLDGLSLEHCLRIINKIKEYGFNNAIYVQDTAKTFFKQQETIKVAKEILKIAEDGNIEKYYECEDLLRKALEAGNEKDNGTDVFDDVDDVLSDDFRNPIPTGIDGLDMLMDGGLSKGELGVILAPFGVGKTTFVTKVANSAKNYGCNVLQIFFEDNPKVIKRKHYSCWSGIPLGNLQENKSKVKEMVIREQRKPGIIKLKKFPSDGTTIPMIRQYIRKLIAQGFKPDVVLLDYIDCVTPSRVFTDVNEGEGNIMRQFESMLDELDVAGWTAVQGNRSSIGAEVVQSDQIGGSIKKGQIGHFIVSVAKTLTQKEDGSANIAILKSRFGKDGVIFRDCIFDNGKMEIVIDESDSGMSFSKAKEVKEEENQDRINNIMEQRRALIKKDDSEEETNV